MILTKTLSLKKLLAAQLLSILRQSNMCMLRTGWRWIIIFRTLACAWSGFTRFTWHHLIHLTHLIYLVLLIVNPRCPGPGCPFPLLHQFSIPGVQGGFFLLLCPELRAREQQLLGAGRIWRIKKVLGNFLAKDIKCKKSDLKDNIKKTFSLLFTIFSNSWGYRKLNVIYRK